MLVDSRRGVNVALNRPAYQVNTLANTLANYYAQYANDGKDTTNMMLLSCAHTNQVMNPWWAVDLGVALHVSGVNFTNRDELGTHYIFFDPSLRIL